MKYERNQTIRSRLIDDLARFRRQILRRGHNFVPTLVCAVPPQIGEGTAEKWGFRRLWCADANPERHHQKPEVF